MTAKSYSVSSYTVATGQVQTRYVFVYNITPFYFRYAVKAMSSGCASCSAALQVVRANADDAVAAEKRHFLDKIEAQTT